MWGRGTSSPNSHRDMQYAYLGWIRVKDTKSHEIFTEKQLN